MIIFASIFKKSMNETKDIQAKHIELLEALSTSYDPGTFKIGGALVKISAKDIIDAGVRLQEIGLFKFKEQENEFKVKIEYVNASPSKKKSKKITDK